MFFGVFGFFCEKGEYHARVPKNIPRFSNKTSFPNLKREFSGIKKEGFYQQEAQLTGTLSIYAELEEIN